MAGETWTAQSPPIKGTATPASGPLRLGRGNTMRRDSVEMTWGEVATALLTLGIVTFLFLV
jgi:hypothetical protein